MLEWKVSLVAEIVATAVIAVIAVIAATAVFATGTSTMVEAAIVGVAAVDAVADAMMVPKVTTGTNWNKSSRTSQSATSR